MSRAVVLITEGEGVETGTWRSHQRRRLCCARQRLHRLLRLQLLLLLLLWLQLLRLREMVIVAAAAVVLVASAVLVAPAVLFLHLLPPEEAVVRMCLLRLRLCLRLRLRMGAVTMEALAVTVPAVGVAVPAARGVLVASALLVLRLYPQRCR